MRVFECKCACVCGVRNAWGECYVFRWWAWAWADLIWVESSWAEHTNDKLVFNSVWYQLIEVTIKHNKHVGVSHKQLPWFVCRAYFLSFDWLSVSLDCFWRCEFFSNKRFGSVCIPSPFSITWFERNSCASTEFLYSRIECGRLESQKIEEERNTNHWWRLQFRMWHEADNRREFQVQCVHYHRWHPHRYQPLVV